ncbi:MAG: NUDIX domain-containing protein [Lachnospiraceae bacterium]|nr:NUDIX domain-containing protein [Lachnospiraceae bacterium]
MEWLDIVDEYGNPTGEKVERSVAHSKGILHRTAHVWLLRRRSGVEILLQKRSQIKDSHPGCYDISSAGHIPAGVDFIPSALRELEEELGVQAKAEDLLYCGQRKIHYENYFHGKYFIDNQISNVYVLWLDREEEQFTLQKEEVEAVRWMDFAECVKAVAENTIENCIVMEELEMINSLIS